MTGHKDECTPDTTEKSDTTSAWAPEMHLINAYLDNPELVRGLMSKPILNTDDNSTPDSMAVATPSFIACVDELTDAGYVSITDNLLNWTNGKQRATIEIIKSTGMYGTVFYPPDHDEPAKIESEAQALYSRIERIEAQAIQDRCSIQTVLTDLNLKTARLLRNAHSRNADIDGLLASFGERKNSTMHLAREVGALIVAANKRKRDMLYVRASIALIGAISLINFAATILH